jgi:hypothetical protein
MKDLTKLIVDLINAALERGEIARRDLIVDRILAEHSEVYGDDAPFYIELAKTAIEGKISKHIGKFAQDPREYVQLVLPGFDYMTKAYPVEREGEHMIVPVDQCTDVELLARAMEFDQMAAGLKLHAREIREYVRARAEERGGAA